METDLILRKRYSRKAVAAMRQAERETVFVMAAILDTSVVERITVGNREALLFKGHDTAWISDHEFVPVMTVTNEFREKAITGRYSRIELAAWLALQPVVSEAEKALLLGHRRFGHTDPEFDAFQQLGARGKALNLEVMFLQVRSDKVLYVYHSDDSL